MSIRSSYSLGFIIVAVLLLTSVYFQLFQGFIPCPLCTLQRLSFVLLGGCFFLALIFSQKYIRLSLNLLASLAALMGIFFSGRQVWLQFFPSEASTECGVSIQYMMQVLPLNEVAQKILTGSAECSERGWTFLSLNMAQWALIWFIGLFFFTLYLFKKVKK